MTIRLSGLASGLDTESIVSALVSAYDYKKEKYVKAQTKLSWKQDAWKSLNSKVYSLYTSVGNMRYSSNYSMKKTTVSDSTKASVTASSSAINGTQTLKINRLAKAGYVTGSELDDDTTSSTKLSSLGYTLKNMEGKIQVKVGSETKSFSVTASSTIEDVIDGLNDCGVTASYDSTNHRIFVSSAASGTSNDFKISAGNTAGMEALSSLGLLTSTDVSNQISGLFTKSYDTDGTTLTGMSLAISDTTLASGISATVSDGKVTAIDYNADNVYSAVNTAVSAIRYAYLVASDDGKDDSTYTADEISAAKTTIETYKNNGWIDFIGMSEDEWYSTTTDEAKASVMSKIDSTIKLAAAKEGVSVTMADGTTSTFDGAYALAKTTTNSAIGKTYYSSDSTSTAITKIFKDLYDSYATLSDEDATDDEITAAKATIESYATIATSSEDSLSDDDKYTKTVLDYIDANYGLAITDSDGNVDYENTAWNNMTSNTYSNKLNSLLSEIDMAASVKNNSVSVDLTSSNLGTRVTGSDAEIELNGATFTSSSNDFTINGLTIQCTGTTDSELTITTGTDTAGLYDKVKEFLSSYNSLINEMMTLYNADSASDYEPLTDDEKSEMSDTEIEKWEQKIKDSLLRRDSTLSSLITGMTTSMMSVININGKDYSWYDFGVSTLGYLNSEENENYAYHIDGDSEDSNTSGNEDKLNAALASDPDTVIEFLKGITSKLYSSLDEKMKSNAVSSVYTVYNDKEMASEYSDYTTLIKTWTTRISDMEDSYYDKFAAMESALATLQSNSSSISSLLG